MRKIAENYKLPYYTLSPTYSICKKHGYVAGEQYTCPECGEPTEVYSRITGYYRPVQNWNDGKTQEYKDRKVYDIGRSTLTHDGPVYHNDEACDCCTVEVPQEAEVNGKILLFATATCPKCKMIAARLEKAGIPYTKLIAEENPELVAQFAIRQAPTLVVRHQSGSVKYAQMDEIIQFIEKQ